ncbi:MAG: hypothetical protein DRO00_06195 [Thermoproteota archaeon]|nr:MAG: hypothetical protein DRO00_06195 [Candidatus Korarchaeota archaeon]
MDQNDLENLIEKLGGEMIDVGKPVKTVAQAAKHTNSSPKQIIKSLVFISEKIGPVLAIVEGDTKADVEKLSKLFGSCRLANPDEVLSITGYRIGEVPPVGLKIKTVVDKRVLSNTYVIGGGGRIDRLSKLDPRRIVEYQNAEVLDISKE